MTETKGRHLHWSNFETQVLRGVPFLERIEGSPRIETFMDHGAQRIGLRIHTASRTIPQSPLAEIAIDDLPLAGERVIEVSTSTPALHRQFYEVICELADGIQVEGRDPGAAIKETLEAWARLLQRLALLSEEEQIGLTGELWFLEMLGTRLGWAAALETWQGPGGEEHDFALPHCDVEVKTTLAEQAVHRISSLSQCEPKLGRPLYVVSIQLTPLGSAGGMTLAERVTRALALARAAGMEAEDRLLERLAKCGWSPQQARFYVQPFGLRCDPCLVAVDEEFPAITRASLGGLGPARLARLDGVSYRVNLAGLGMPAGSAMFHATLFEGVQGD